MDFLSFSLARGKVPKTLENGAKLLSIYKNGNYQVAFYSDGTKARFNNEDTLKAEFPESMDLCLSKRCENGCAFCYQGSTINGPMAGPVKDYPFLETLRPYTEVALDVGGIFSFPYLDEYLEFFHNKHIFANITINQLSLNDEHAQVIKDYLDKGLLTAIGVSVNKVTSDLVRYIQLFGKNTVLHVINGIIDLETLKTLYDYDFKLLILGYKTFGRGAVYHDPRLEKNQLTLRENLDEIAKHFAVVSFDNLALEQLSVRSWVGEETWQNYYMGDDGQFTMYVDLVNKQFSRNSIAPANERFSLTNDIFEMFKSV